MEAGILAEVLEVYTPTVTVNDYHGQDIEYVFKYKTRASVRQLSGGRADENNEVVYPYVKEFIVRSYVPVEDNDILKWNGKSYRILNIDETDANTLMRIKIEAELMNE